MSGQYHIPVLRDEVIDFLITKPEGVYVDGTLGGAGHAERIAEKIYPAGTLIGIDADADAQAEARERLRRFSANTVFVHDNNANIRSILQTRNIPTIQGLLLDLGVSSFQLDEGSKGFSYRTNDVLDMRMDRRQGMTAATVVNSYSDEQLADIFWKYGEERNSRRIARAIVERRSAKKIETSADLASVVEEKIHAQFLTKSLARIFQALRIEVNSELESLSRALHDSLTFLASGGRIVVISYHSLEDRIVKNFFQENSATVVRSGHKLVPDTPAIPMLKILTKKPIAPSTGEQRSNPRSRSAKMRVAERV
ncbi:MAG TPA: 16S rRNA (cytosine(1402)-N(4))-methyltransferase RsmH [Bacteroidota bacterium]|nr:16S rRNA (cytosine(1402)-N(4))-methyltransferase RsmH [Bacteroidota bacterium]